MDRSIHFLLHRPLEVCFSIFRRRNRHKVYIMVRHRVAHPENKKQSCFHWLVSNFNHFSNHPLQLALLTPYNLDRDLIRAVWRHQLSSRDHSAVFHPQPTHLKPVDQASPQDDALAPDNLQHFHNHFCHLVGSVLGLRSGPFWSHILARCHDCWMHELLRAFLLFFTQRVHRLPHAQIR